MKAETILKGLTPEQYAAATHIDGPLLIVAGAGSGKTRTVTRRVAYMISQGVDPRSILAITFTNKAAGEMRGRIAELIPGSLADDAGPTVATFHAFALRLLRRFGKQLGYSRGFSVLDPAEQLALVREAAVSERVDVKRFNAYQIAERIGRVKESLDDDAFYAAAVSDLDRAVAKTLPRYRELLRRRGAMDFDDLVAESVRLLETNESVRDLLLDEVRYVSIDEYQDTNRAQYRLANLLAGERRNLAVVGDPDQSIYAWRGADMRNILNFETDYPDAKVVLLEQNYRSTARILQVANALIEHNAERKDKQLLPTGAQGELIQVIACTDAQMEAETIARRVKKVLDAGTPPSEVAVIFRGKAHADAYEEALVRHNIPCSIVGSTSFFERREIKDALAWVRLAVNPRDDLAALRALKHTSKGIGGRTLDKLFAYQRSTGLGLVEVCEKTGQISGLTPARKGELSGFARRVRELQAQGQQSVEKLVFGAIHSAHLRSEEALKDPNAEARQKNLDRLLGAARNADKKGGAGAAQRFLDRLALIDSQDKGDDAPDRVVLTTVHAAKGLEFDVVFVAGLEEGLFPHHRSVEEGMLEEERRLAYVAFTRARETLVLTYAEQRRSRNPKARSNRMPSMFLYELPKALLWDPIFKEPMQLPDPKAQDDEPAPAPSAAEPAEPRAKSKTLGVKPLVAKTGATKKTKPLAKPAAAKQADAKTPLWKQGLLSSRGR